MLDLGRLGWPQVSGLKEGALTTMAAGVVAALIAAIPGFADYSEIRRDHPSRKLATAHLLLNLVAVGIYAVNIVARCYQANRATEGKLPWMLSVAGMALLALSGHLGSKLIFEDGISVGRHRRKTRLPRKTLAVSSNLQRDAQGFARVASTDQVEEGGTLRVEMAGQVMVHQDRRNDRQVRSRIKLCGQVRDRGSALESLKRNVDKRSGRAQLVIIAIADHESVRLRRGVGIRTTGWGSSETRPT